MESPGSLRILSHHAGKKHFRDKERVSDAVSFPVAHSPDIEPGISLSTNAHRTLVQI